MQQLVFEAWEGGHPDPATVKRCRKVSRKRGWIDLREAVHCTKEHMSLRGG